MKNIYIKIYLICKKFRLTGNFMKKLKVFFILSLFIQLSPSNMRADWELTVIGLGLSCGVIILYGVPIVFGLDWLSSKISSSGKPILGQIINNPLIDKPELIKFNYNKYQTHCMTPALMAGDIYSVHIVNSIEQEIGNGTIVRGDISDDKK